MDGVIDRDGARALVGNAALWPHVRDFLWDFAPQVHASWLDDASLVSRFATSPRVKRLVLESLGIAPCFHAFPKEDGSRLLLLDAATLESLVRWLGALACAEELRKITDGATVKALKAALPGVYPEVFGYVAYFSNLDFQRRGAETPRVEETVVRAGHEVLSVALSGLPAALVSRLKFKFAKDSAFASLASRLVSEDGREPLAARRAKAQAQVLKLLKLKFPEAYLLCCS